MGWSWGGKGRPRAKQRLICAPDMASMCRLLPVVAQTASAGSAYSKQRKGGRDSAEPDLAGGCHSGGAVCAQPRAHGGLEHTGLVGT
jgi:hypothetical protein